MEQVYIDGRCEFFSDFEDCIRYLKTLPKYESLAEGIEHLVNLKVASLKDKIMSYDCNDYDDDDYDDDDYDYDDDDDDD